MTAVDVVAGMGLPSLAAGHKLRPVLATALRDAADAQAPAPVSHTHWEAAYFGLDRTGLFTHASVDAQSRILDACGRGLIEEAYFIEKAGIAFAAKMILLADTVDERMLYALFAADEATHFSAVRGFLVAPPDAPSENAFLDLLSGIIESGDRTTLQFVIQVVLEGWGLKHYRAMRDACTSPALTTVFDGILADEAAHHGSGRVLFEGAAVSDASARAIGDVLAPFLGMVQAGPQGVVGAVEGVLGPLPRRARVRLFEELDGRVHSGARLAQLRALMRGDRARDIVANLDSLNAFTPLSPEDCA